MLLYVVAIIALPTVAIIWIDADVRRQAFSGTSLGVAIFIYIAAVWFGFWALKRIFRRQRQAIAAEQRQ
jgi:NADH:ubiquinone oxidoreductase subunit 6 (subunit J)